MIKELNFERIFYLLLPIFLILGGIRTIVNSEFKMWSNTLAIGFTAQLGGAAAIVVGVIFLIIILNAGFKK